MLFSHLERCMENFLTAWKRKKVTAWIWQQNNFLFRIFAVFGKTKEKAM